jgi:predicted Zn-dependent peptidase
MRSHQLTTLPSGLRVVSERMPGIRSTALGVWVGVGSRDEQPRVSGLSHFIEHLLFRGSERHTALEIAQIFDRFGAELNAATSREHTSVYARVIDAQLPEAVGVIGNMVRAPTWADLEQEREVVLEEIAMYEDTPDDLVHDLIGQAVFPGQGLGRPIVGTREVLEAITEADAHAHHATWYVPGNIVVAAAGSIEHGQLVELVAAELDAGVRAGVPERARALVGLPPERLFAEKDTEQYHVCLGATGIRRDDERRFAATLLDQILGGGASSRLFQEIRERRGMAYSVYSYGANYADTGSVGIYVGTRAENLDECLEVTVTEITQLAERQFQPDELARAKDSIKGRLTLSMESTSARMSRLGRNTLEGVELLDEDEVCARVDAVTEEQLAELAAELYHPSRLSAACIGPDRTVFDRALGALDGAPSEVA